jgi:hypothetical protein
MIWRHVRCPLSAAWHCRRVLWALLIRCVATSARAGSITVVWDPNAVTFGYMVSYGRSPGWTEVMVDVGPTTA